MDGAATFWLGDAQVRARVFGQVTRWHRRPRQFLVRLVSSRPLKEEGLGMGQEGVRGMDGISWWYDGMVAYMP